ncbi:hypothetical protein HYH03_001450 [Edaphochlamys debaryana]|uniref:Protein HIRA n=1 Tax=Edaphochlamys debaryana TaxID=47281 RepID=A0A835YF99_9CHLO|nr:hypothetical protein HYH03_001450 [Edaphochlamys debaryana]|eukprot:KAG2500684.1 hypothetical protein HYH03_001450 [Edaphochlamys debaryana]
MPTVDKPEWIQHGGAALHGVDLDHTGERLATAGADNKVRIWAMRPVLSSLAEQDPSVPKQLACISDSTTPVNCVRFAPSGKLLAAGSDDADVFVYELREGRGTALFGSGEAANVENWRLKLRLRGHETNVSDVAWAPDGRRLATASVDNKVKVWDAQSGHCIRTLEGHRGHVKGVAWDPFDVFLASQSDSEAIVWRLEDGSAVARVEEPFMEAPAISFALRPSWSPDGQVLALANGYDKGIHTVPVLRRNSWYASEISFCGHRAPVTVCRYNPHLYLPSKSPAAANGASAATAASGGGDDDAVGPICAIGSTDKKFSLWYPSKEGPLAVGSGFFDRMINDLAWSPDGRVLVVVSYDGTVGTMVFAEGELGRRLPDAEVQALFSELYGDPRIRSAKSALTAAPEMLQLEAKARADVEKEQRLQDRLGAMGRAATAVGAAALGLGPASGGAIAAAPAAPQQAGAAAPAATGGTANGGPPPAATALPLPRPLAALSQNAQPAAGTSGGARAGSSPAKAGGRGRDPDHPPPAKRAAGAHAVGAAAPAPSAAAAAGRQAGAASASGAGGAAASAILPDPAVAAAAAGFFRPAALVPHEPVKSFFATLIHASVPSTSSSLELNSLAPNSNGQTQITLELQAYNNARDARGRPTAELVLLAGPVRRWADVVPGHVVSMAGSSRLAVVSTTNGDLMVYSPAGRRLFPPIRVGCPAAFLSAAPGSAQVLALLTDGSLRVWDFAAGEVTLETSVAPLLAQAPPPPQPAQHQPGAPPPLPVQPLRVTSAKLSAAGSPLLLLSNAHAYVHHPGLKIWMRVADDAFPASAYTTSLTSSTTGELGKLQASVAQRRHPADVIATAAAHSARPVAAARSEQALLETNLAAAAALQSASEWRQWLITYVRRLAADEDESRLRELIAELMGPLRWSPGTHAPAPASATTFGRTASALALAAAPAASSAPAPASAAASEPGLGSCVTGRWQPSMLGLDKRRLLREVVLKEVSKNRACQQLVAEVLDQLRAVEGPAAARAQAAQAAAAAGAAGGLAGAEAAGQGQAGGGPAGPGGSGSAQPMAIG